MRPLLIMFLGAIGLNKSQPSEQVSDNKKYIRMAGDKKPTTETTICESQGGKDGDELWSTSTKDDSRDVPLNTIHVQKEYEQHVEAGTSDPEGWTDGKRKSYYPS